MRLTRELMWRIELAWNAPSREAQETGDMHRMFRERQRLAEEYAAGYLAGWHECLDACVEAMAAPQPWPRGEN